MTAAELVVKIQADISNLTRKLTEGAAEVKAFGAETERSSSKMKNAWRDAETGLLNFDRAQKNVRSGFNNGPLGLVGAIGDGIAAILKFSNFMQRGVYDLGQWVQGLDQGGMAMTQFGGAISALAPLAGLAGVGIAALIAGLILMPVVAGAAVFILTVLADTIGTLGAMVYAALGPLGVLAAILGGVGAAFFLAGQRAIKGGGAFTDFAARVEKVVGQFHDLIYTIGERLLPVFNRLAGAASIALHYFGQLAQMPLNEAFHSLATKGAKMLASFVTQAGHILANPFRLAIRIAFSQGTAQQQLGGILSHLGGYLFGQTISVPVSAHRGAAQGASVMPKFQPGALQPIINWFNRHNFTKTGERWGNEIVKGIEHSGILGRLGTWLLSVLKDAGRRAWHAFVSAAEYEIKSAIPRLLTWLTTFIVNELRTNANWLMREYGRAWDWIKSKAAEIWKAITSAASSEFHHIASNLQSMWSSAVSHIRGDWNSFTNWLGNSVSGAWNAIKSKATSIWNQIISFIERPLTIHINWPSPPGWLGSIIGGGGSILGGASSFIRHHTAAGGIVTRPTNVLAGESGAEAIIPLTGGMGRHALGAMGGGGGGVTININNPTFMSGGRPAARELARILKPELDRIVRSGR